jgi:putative hydrolase of the HAD superfamily
VAAIEAVIFDLGGTLIDWPDWDEDILRRWGLSYEYLTSTLPTRDWPPREAYVQAMRAAEREHWQQVVETQASNTPTGLLRSGFERLGRAADEEELLVALDGYARAVNGWAIVFPDATQTLEELRRRGYRLGLLSNTWWAAEWHNAELAMPGLAPLLDEVVYTSDLSHSKPHPSTFLEVTHRLDVDPRRCVMVGDRLVDDISGALGTICSGLGQG